MKLNFLISFLTGSIVLVSNVVESGATFKYLYQIKANSYTPRDSVNLYYYKEKLIDKYEDIAFSIKEEYLSETLKQNISEFKFDSSCYPEYKNGVIVLTLGQGKGSVIEGRLRFNNCDNDVIREKIFIFDIFR